MKTSSRRSTLKSLALGAAALLPIVTAAVVLAVTAADAPPAAPVFATEDATSPTGGVFVYNHAALTGTVRFNAVTQTAPATIGYRLYLGTAARTAGSPYILGNTPCDIGASTTANIQTCLVPASSIANASIHVAVTAYNQFGNEGDYSADRVFVPVRPPTGIAVTPPVVGANTKQMSLSWVQGTAPGNITAAVITEVFRRPAGSTGAYAKIFSASGNGFTDTGLTRDTSYEYVFRSKATPTGSTVSTYSAVTAAQTKIASIPEDSFTVTVPGNRGAGNPLDVGTAMVAGERAQLSQPGGNVVFDTQDATPGCTYSTGPNGLSQATYDANASFCYPIDHCDPDPRENINHAALLVKVGGGQPDAVGNGGPVSGPGQLSFLVNDCRPSNNSGSFSVQVTIGKP